MFKTRLNLAEPWENLSFYSSQGAHTLPCNSGNDAGSGFG